MMSIRRWSGFFVVMVAVLALACGKKDKDSGKQEPPKTTKPGKDGNKPKPSVKLGPSPFPQLKMVVDGKPVPVHSIYAYWVGEEAVKIEVSSAKRSCNMHPQMRNNLPGEKFVKIWFSKQLDKQGKASWAVVQSYFAGGTNQDKKRKSVSITASPATVGGHVEGTLSIAQEGFARRNRPAQKLYRRCGFEDTGLVYAGASSGPQHIYALRFAVAPVVQARRRRWRPWA